MSDKKKLLEESQIRRMMKIAGIPALGETFMSNYSRFTEEEEEEVPMEDPMAGEEAGEEAPMEDPMAGEEAPMEPAGEAIPQDKVEAIVDAVLAGIQQETGVPLERVPGEGEAAEAPMEDPMAGGEEVAAVPEEEPMPEEDPVMEGGKYKREDEEDDKKKEEKEDDLEEALKAAGIQLTKGNKSKLVNEVARRVARRLVRESKRKSK